MPTLQQVVSRDVVVVGLTRSGVGAVQSLINNHPEASCHSDLFHESEEVRRQAHRKYFGSTVFSERCPDWYIPGETPPDRYLDHQLFRNPMRGEKLIGVCLHYEHLDKLDLYDYFEERSSSPYFLAVHVLRNPLACLVSKLQAQKSGLWRAMDARAGSQAPPAPVYIDPEEAKACILDFERTCRRVRRSCRNMLEIKYHDFFANYDTTLRELLRFLGLEFTPIQPNTQRLRNRRFSERIMNWTRLHQTADKTLRYYLTTDLS